MSAIVEIPTDAEISDITRTHRFKSGLRTIQELRDIRRNDSRIGYLVDGLLKCTSISMVIGDSGLGKSPLLYQLALSVAAGIPFLDRKTKQGRVVYIDTENGVEDVILTIDGLSTFLGTDPNTENFLSFNLNDCPGGWTPDKLSDVLSDGKPDLVIIDPVNGIYPEFEDGTKQATAAYQDMRVKKQKYDCAFVGVHHLRKSDHTNAKAKPPSLEGKDFREWFQMARGARAIINGSDVRLGIERAERQEDVLAMRGFARVAGEVPLMYIERVFDEDGEPVGYRAKVGTLNPDQQACFDAMPPRFSFSDLKRQYGRGAQATTDMLRKLRASGQVKKIGKDYVTCLPATSDVPNAA